ncbi:MAG: ABC transporter permease [Betaproteobacteria bacterium]
MNAMHIAFPLALAYLRDRLLATCLNILLLALGIATIVSLLLTLSQAEQRMDRDAAGIDLVVGAKGSPLQLILSSVFQVDIPTGNIPLVEARRIAGDAMVRKSVPLALGDSYGTFRIVGTTPDYLSLYAAEIHSGRVWSRPMEVIVGAEVAARKGLQLGQRIAGNHGLTETGAAHTDKPFEVVGILKPTGAVIDRLVLTAVDSVWAVHTHQPVDQGDVLPDDEKELTALLIQYATPLAAASFPRRVNAISGLQAASPAMEIARLFSLLGFGIGALKLFAGIMMVCAGLGIFIGLSNALDDRRADLALLRLLGASRTTVFLTILVQGFALGMAGVILGLALGHAGTEWMAQVLPQVRGLGFTGWTWISQEGMVAGGALLLALLAGCVPALRAYRDTGNANAIPELLGQR